ncbi:YeeE/YedE family protein [Hoeflea sp. YIM 152468]|uniref:YeeE/YedE family protein n=1 Tax=Hoeflea sp. YIM 152468 TaxID=3031759 RepID=UPI0023DCB088|nr:YeeE/YedE family protein [Hoeflea sp. YIM 152468]MDF1609427.1 YeeE/YedE family protein [Hoeflea sp. YIM 152468]
MFDSGWILALSGCLVGAIIGFAARKSHFCTMAALERHWYAGDDRPLRAWALAAFTALIATQLLAAAGFADLDRSFYITEPLPIAGAIIGGLMFGLGMALVGTCGFGALVRLGGGNLRALVVLTGLGLAALAAQRGVTGYIRTELLDPLALDLSGFGGQSAGALLTRATGLNLQVPLALLIGAAGLWWVFKSASFRADRNRLIAGLVIGLCIAAGWVITGLYAAHALHPVQIEAGSFVMPVGDTILQIITVTGELPDYGVGLIVGVFLGASISAFRSDDMRWEACDDARELSRHLLGAFLMGTGGVFALGCTIGQGVSAFSVMAISAPIVMISIAAGARMGLGLLMEGNAFGFLADWRAPKAHPSATKR